MVGRLGDVAGNVQQEDTKTEQQNDADLDLLRGRTEEDGQQEDTGHERRHYHVDDVEQVTSTQVNGEGDVGEHLTRQTGVGQLLVYGTSRQYFPLAVSFVRIEVDAARGISRQVHLK